jgi:hypothetical protein
LRIAGSILICLILLLLAARVTGFEPKDCPTVTSSSALTLSCRLPGLWRRGDVVTTPVTDWSFTDKIQNVKIQTQTPILLPYSVEAWCVAYHGNFYVTSYPGRLWVDDIIRDPHVRLKLGSQLFDRTFTLVSDTDEKAAVLLAKSKKYPQWKVPPVSTVTIFRVSPGQ